MALVSWPVSTHSALAEVSYWVWRLTGNTVILGAYLHKWLFPQPPLCCGWCSLSAAGFLCKVHLFGHFDGFCRVRRWIKITTSAWLDCKQTKVKWSQMSLHSGEKYWCFRRNRVSLWTRAPQTTSVYSAERLNRSRSKASWSSLTRSPYLSTKSPLI